VVTSGRTGGWGAGGRLLVERSRTAGPGTPGAFTEVRYLAHERMQQALHVIPAVAAEFGAQFGRDSGGLVRPYRTEDAEIVVVGSVLGTAKDVVDDLRTDDLKVGVLGITSFRPFPDQAIRDMPLHVLRQLLRL
jgi:pyruvate ferredoxin oxidoreductase alpha subunit